MIKVNINGQERDMKIALNEITVSEFEQLCIILTESDEDILDRYLKMFSVLGLTDEEIDTITPADFIALSNKFSSENWDAKDFKQTIEINGVIYTAFTGAEFKLSVRDLSKIEKYIKQNKSRYMAEILAVIYKDLSIDRTLHYDDSHIKSKAEIFRTSVTADTIIPYVNLILKDIAVKLKENAFTK